MQELKTSQDFKSGIDGLVEDADKLLKGAETLLEALKKDTARSSNETAFVWQRH